MLASEWLAELKRRVDERGDFQVVVRSDEFGYEPAQVVDFVEHDGDDCLLVD